MTEEQWITATDPQEMLLFLRNCGRASERKSRLFACACCRRVWHLLSDERSRWCVEAAEMYADRMFDGIELEEVAAAAERAAATAGHESWAAGQAAFAAVWAADWDHVDQAADSAYAAVSHSEFRPLAVEDEEGGHQLSLLRDIVGNPFGTKPHIPEGVLAWNEGTIPKLAEAAYQERALPSGELDRDRLAVLADALEEVGADDLLLGHLRGAGPRVRGDWVVDLLTGRE